MKKLCFFNSNRAWGGGEFFNWESALRMRDRGYDVTVVTNAQSELYNRLRNEPGLSLLSTRITGLSFLNPFKIMELARFFRERRIETLITALPSDYKAAGLAARLAGVPNIIFRRGIAVPVRDTFLNRFLYRHVATQVIANSLETKRTILQNNPALVDPDKIKIVYCSFDVAAFDATAFTKVYERRGDEIILGNAGRLEEQKGQKYLIEMARILKDQGLNFRLLIAGKGTLEEALKARAAELGVEDVVLFLGFVTNMRDFYESIDIFTMSSLWEGFGYVQMEAMTARRPLVGFSVSSIPEVIDNGRTGFLVEVGDVEGYADKVRQLMIDPGLRERFGAAGRKRVEDNWDISKVVETFEKLL